MAEDNLPKLSRLSQLLNSAVKARNTELQRLAESARQAEQTAIVKAKAFLAEQGLKTPFVSEHATYRANSYPINKSGWLVSVGL